MKIALVTTTINVPHVLRLYRRADPDVRFFVAVDKKTPSWTEEFGKSLEPVTPCWGEEWKCSELIGWNCIQRRNIATLEALRWGADTIVFWDDDNLTPEPINYFKYYQMTLHPQAQFNGMLASPEIDWFDVGALYDPLASHRGFPHQLAHRAPRFSFVTDARIGAHAGLVILDPDISAMTRITRAPTVHRFSELLRHGVAVNPRFTRTVWNTQNSAVRRELAPAMLLCPQFGRYDDIIASLVCQRVMADTGHHVLFGLPVCAQERNVHDLSRDLADEAWGQAHLLHIATMLNGKAMASRLEERASDSIVSKVATIYEMLQELPGMPDGVAALAGAWLQDCVRAMS